MYSAESNQNAQKNYYESDQPAELARSGRRYRTTDPEGEYYLMQRLIALRDQIEKEQQMFAARQRRLRHAEYRSSNQNNYAESDKHRNTLNMIDSDLGGPQRSTSETESADSELGTVPVNLFTLPLPTIPGLPPLPALPSLIPTFVPAKPVPTQPSYSPKVPPPAAYAPPPAPSAPAPYVPHFTSTYQPSYYQPEPVQYQQQTPCAKNLLVGCQPHVQQVPCSSSSYEPQPPQYQHYEPPPPPQYQHYESSAPQYHPQPLPHYRNEVQSVRLESEEPSHEIAHVSNVQAPVPSTQMARSNDLNEKAECKAKVTESPTTTTTTTEKPSIEVSVASVMAHPKEIKHTEPEGTKILKENEVSSPTDRELQQLNAMDEAREKFLEMINARKRAQLAGSGRVIPPTVSRPLPNVPTKMRSEYNNPMWN